MKPIEINGRKLSKLLARSLTVVFILCLYFPTQEISASDLPKALPASDGNKADPTKPVKVYVMLGQSNMLGFGRVEPKELKGTLEHFVHSQGMYPHLVDRSGKWIVRQDVRYVHVMDRRGVDYKELEKFQVVRNEWLVPRKSFGPELGFGQVMGDYHDAPVLLLKACIGNRSLGWDLLPPGSERFEHEGKVYAGYKDVANFWEKDAEAKAVPWYAGRQYDADVAHAKSVLSNLATYYPEYKDQGYEVAGFVWWQGHKDQSAALASRYEMNLVHLIKSLRNDFQSPNAKFVLATGCGNPGTEGFGKQIAEAQLAVDGESGKYPEFKQNVKAVDTRDLWREADQSPANQGHHYNHNAQTYYETGERLGRAMAFLLEETDKVSTWQSHAEPRLKSIYDRGEFRAKSVQPNWLSDSSGFLIDEIDPNTKKPTPWHYDAKTGERRAATEDEIAAGSNIGRRSVNGDFRLEARGAKLVAVNHVDRTEITLASSPADRKAEFRNPVWSPDGSKVLFIEADFSNVKQRWVLVPEDPSYPEVQQNRFARVGGDIEKLRIGVVNKDGEQMIWLPIDCPEEGMYLGQVEWAGNSQEVLVERFSRFRNKRDFLLYSVNGDVKTIFTETNDAWAESSQGKNSGLVWIRGGQEFIVVSEKDGWRHAYRYSRDGKELAPLTPGNYDVIDRSVIDEDRGWYYFFASPQDGTQKYLYRVALDGSGKLDRVTPEDQIGTHGYLFSPDTKWAIHTFSTLNTPPVLELIEVASHRVVKLLEDNSQIRERMKSLTCQPAEFLKLDIGNGIEFDAWMLKPKDFDPDKKYPLFVYVYGEPHAQTVLNEWGTAQIDFHRVVAELGYVVVSIDNRGTPCPKGAAWRRAIFGSLGPLSTDEQEAGLKALAKQCSFIDTDRVGIWGWSGGGSNTLNALFRKPESYHVGIAVVPKPQPHLYNAWFQEIYMRTREVNPEGYERSAPINFAEGLKGKLLIMTGSGETNTHIQIIEGLVDRLISLGKPFDYMVYPNRDHGLREGDGTLVHVRMHILRYLIDNLPQGPR